MKKILVFLLTVASLVTLGSPVKSNEAAKGIDFTNEGSSIPSVTEYIQDGLVAMWDGVENIGFNAHHRRPSAWIDLVGGATFFLTAADTITPNSIVFSRRAESTLLEYDTNKVYSVYHTCRVYNPTHAKANIFQLLSDGTSSSVGAYAFDGGIPVRVFRGVNFQNMIRQSEWTDDDTFVGQIGIAYSVIKSSDDPKSLCVMYHNGQQFYSLRGSNWRFNYAFNARGTYKINFTGSQEQEVYSIKIYDRELTAEEVEYNYELDRIRFNLP